MATTAKSPIPWQYQKALRTAEHRTTTTLRGTTKDVRDRLVRRGIAGDRDATMQDIRFARRVAQNAISSTGRDVARILSMNRYDAAVASVNLHDLSPVARNFVLDQLKSGLPSLLDDSTLARGTMGLASGWLDTLIGNLSSSLGNLTANDVLNAIVDWLNPNVSGGLSYAADRLVQNQLAESFHDAQLETASVQGIQTVFWRLDPGHEGEDECDDYADQEFNIDDVPELPHVGCLCYLEPGQFDDGSQADTPSDQGQAADEDEKANAQSADEMSSAQIKGAVEVPLASTPDTVQAWAEKLRADAGDGATVRVMQTPSGGYTYHVFK